LEDVLKRDKSLNASAVGIRGWSFGGYLAAGAVLLAPERIHAAIAGAPVTDWRDYDTHYSERYLGSPKANKDAYDACSITQLADRLKRPLLLIHGVEDDNVFVTHTLKLSKRLFELGKEHYVLLLSGVTHMTSSGGAAASLLKAQVEFLRRTIDSDRKK
jgi:dipeptidyl-peptidase-4